MDSGAGCAQGARLRRHRPPDSPGPARDSGDGVDNNCDTRIDDLPGVGDFCEQVRQSVPYRGQRACDMEPAGGVHRSGWSTRRHGDAAAATTSTTTAMASSTRAVRLRPPPRVATTHTSPTTPATAHSVTVNQGRFGFTCTTDKDFFALPTAGQAQRLNLTLPTRQLETLSSCCTVQQNAAYVAPHRAPITSRLSSRRAPTRPTTPKKWRTPRGDQLLQARAHDSWACSEEDALENNDNLSLMANLLPSGGALTRSSAPTTATSTTWAR